MKLLLLSLALLGVATATSTEQEEGIKEILAKHNVTAEGIQEFLDLNLGEMPFTPEHYSLWKNWTAKWNVDIPELEKKSNQIIMDNLAKEAERRSVEFFTRVAARLAVFSEVTNIGGWTNDTAAKWHALSPNSTAEMEFEQKIVELVNEEMMYNIGEEWGLQTLEGAPEEPEADTTGDDKAKDDANDDDGDVTDGEDDDQKDEGKEEDKEEDKVDDVKGETKEDEKAEEKPEEASDATEKPE